MGLSSLQVRAERRMDGPDRPGVRHLACAAGRGHWTWGAVLLPLPSGCYVGILRTHQQDPEAASISPKPLDPWTSHEELPDTRLRVLSHRALKDVGGALGGFRS